MNKYIVFFTLLSLFSCSRENQTVKIKGSDTEVNLVVQLAEAFHSVENQLFVSISGGGSGLGIASLLNGTADLANSSRSINHEELRLFHQKNIALDSFIFAQDAIAFVVSEKMPIDSVTTSVLAKILDGTYSNWSSLIQQKMPINIYGRQSNSGTYEFVKLKLNIQFSAHAKEMNGNAQILEAIKADASGIGYVGAGYVLHGGNKGIKVLKIAPTEGGQAISPLDEKAIANNQYLFQRNLFQFFKPATYHKIKPFLDFEKSEKGQKIIRAAGYYPVKLF